jgi:nucleotide-binding universal stress UspA family protein
MISIRTVLCPVDFSMATGRQIALATDLCQAFNASLVLHHNLATLAAGAGVGWMWAADHPDQSVSEGAAEQKLRALAAQVPDTVTVQASMSHGNASQAVLDIGDAIDADLVVLSTHGATTEEHASITEHMIEHATRPVLALHELGEDAHMPTFASTAHERQVVVVPTDLTPEASAAVDVGFDLARKLPIELHLLHLLKHGAAEEARRRLEGMIPEDLAGRAQLHVEDGQAAQGIAQAAERLSAACIVMGEHTRAPLRRWFSRDTSRAVLHRAPCPVWYVPGQRAA